MVMYLAVSSTARWWIWKCRKGRRQTRRLVTPVTHEQAKNR